MAAAFNPGQRVLIGGAAATVKYSGPVEGTKAGTLWVGVDYDDPARGKHDGTHDGKRYFTASGPTAGAFVKEGKVDRGVGLMDAVRDKYGLLEQASGDKDQIREVQRSINAPFMEMVGFEKVNAAQANFSKLRVLGLVKSKIRGLGDDERDISALIPKTTDLDLEDNLLSDWDEITAIAAQLPYLKYLNVGSNRMSLPKDMPAYAGALKGVRHLILSKMGLTWPTVASLVQDLPGLTILQVFDNDISDVSELKPGVLENLEQLDLNTNPLGTWKNVERFAHLPKLWILNAQECKLPSIEPPSDASKPYFPALKLLQLGWNGLEEWQSVANLRHIVNLNEVRIRNNPLLEQENGETCRQMFIACIPSLKAFNGSELHRTERYGAELDHLKKFGKEYLAVEAMEDGDAKEAARKDFNFRHPTYAGFVKRYGAPEESELREIKTDIKSSLVEVQIECPTREGFVPVAKKLPPTMTMAKLRPLLVRLVKAPRGADITVMCRSVRDPLVKVAMDNPLRDLSFYCLEHGDSIIVSWEE